MGIDTAIGGLRARWKDETPERLVIFEEGFASLTKSRDNFPWGVYRRRLRSAPASEVTLADVMREMAEPGAESPQAIVNDLAQHARERRTGPREVDGAVERVRASLCRWGLTWNERDEPLELLDGLDPRAMVALAARAAEKHPGDVERSWLDRLRSFPSIPRWKRAFPQLAALDIANMLLPTEHDLVLYGLPYTVSSAPALQTELRALGSGDALLDEALDRCITRQLPLFIDG